jgi:hypothetical protein
MKDEQALVMVEKQTTEIYACDFEGNLDWNSRISLKNLEHAKRKL